MKEVTYQEFISWRNAYPHKLVSDICHLSDPPVELYYDLSIGDRQYGVVAHVILTEVYPKGEEYYPYCWSPNTYRIDERFL